MTRPAALIRRLRCVCQGKVNELSAGSEARNRTRMLSAPSAVSWMRACLRCPLSVQRRSSRRSPWYPDGMGRCRPVTNACEDVSSRAASMSAWSSAGQSIVRLAGTSALRGAACRRSSTGVSIQVPGTRSSDCSSGSLPWLDSTCFGTLWTESTGGVGELSLPLTAPETMMMSAANMNLTSRIMLDTSSPIETQA